VSGGKTARRSLVLGTRGSRLAIWQAEWVQARLRDIAPDVTVTLKRIKTSGDKILDVPLAKIGGAFLRPSSTAAIARRRMVTGMVRLRLNLMVR